MAQTTKEVPKLSPDELLNLKSAIHKHAKNYATRGNLCHKKEIEIRTINENFQKQWDNATFNLDESEKVKKDVVKMLHDKYGKDVSFNLETGEITAIKKEN